MAIKIGINTLFPYTTLFRFRSEERRVGKESINFETVEVKR